MALKVIQRTINSFMIVSEIITKAKKNME